MAFGASRRREEAFSTSTLALTTAVLEVIVVIAALSFGVTKLGTAAIGQSR